MDDNKVYDQREDLFAVQQRLQRQQQQQAERGEKPKHRIMRYFEYGHLPAHLQDVSKPMGELAALMFQLVPEGPEKDAGLRKLLEAKDCFVRAKLPQ
jgi:hypothetical protein